MKRFIIKNLRNGLSFQVEDNLLPERQPEWGSPAGTKLKSECDEWELVNGWDAGLDDRGLELWSFPDSMELNTIDITQELNQRTQERSERLQKIRDIRNATTIATLRAGLLALLDELNIK